MQKKRKKESKYIFVPAPPRTFLLEMSSDIVLCVYELTQEGRKDIIIKREKHLSIALNQHIRAEIYHVYIKLELKEIGFMHKELSNVP